MGFNELRFIALFFFMREILFLLVALAFPLLSYAQIDSRPLPDTLLVCYKAPTPELLRVWEDLPDSLSCKWSSKELTRGRSYSQARIFTEKMEAGFYHFKREILDSTRLLQEDSLILHIVEPPKIHPEKLQIPTCDNSGDGAISLKAYPAGSGYEYVWSNGRKGESLDKLNAATYEVILTDPYGCSSRQSFALMSPEPIFIDLVHKEEASCGQDNGAAVVRASGGVGDFTFQWDTEDAYEGVGLDGLKAGQYTIKAQDSRGCWDTLQIKIRSLPYRRGKISSNPPDSLALCVSEAQISFDAEDRYADRYLWDFGDSTQQESLNPEHKFEAPGNYTVYCMMYEEGNDCPARDSLTFEIQHDGEIVIPELFSPNGDGVNDYFYVRGFMQSIDLRIFNKNGRLVKTISDAKEKWNGRTEEGRKLSKGEYRYELKAQLSVCKDFEQEGIIRLVR